MKLSKEEKLILKMEKEAARKLRQCERKMEKESIRQHKEQEKNLAKAQREEIKNAKKKAPKQKSTEEELVLRYANRTIRNQQYHGRTKGDLQYERSVSKNLYLDTDFFFSVVFQSRAQKFEFFEKWEQMHSAVDSEIPSRVQIINGLKLAKALGIELKKEQSLDYPTGNIDLLPFILDNEKTNGGHNG